MSSGKQQRRPASEPDASPAAKRARPEPATGSLRPGGPLRVALNPADCDLDFNIDGTGLEGYGLHEQGFAYCWSGARANVAITGGKYCFGCKIVAEQVVDMSDTPSDQQHVCRVGISRGDDPVGNLGESLHSFGFGGTGKFSNARKFSDYGEKFGGGDTIVCAIDLEAKPLATIGFSKNGKWLGIASQFDASSRGLGVVGALLKNLPWESALFPHVLLKNVVVQLQFSIEDGLIPVEGYKPWNSAIEDGNVIIGPTFFSPEECEVLMMVGLPASGKTTWAENWVKRHPEKRYVILGTNLALDQMKVPGLLRKQNYGERFDRLMDRATGIFNMLLARAATTPRNYILDQTNVYKSARNRKLKAFFGYRKIAVVVFPSPDELRLRADKRFKEMGKEVPQDAVNEMLANYVLPMTKDVRGSNELFDEVIFTELDRVEAERYLDEMKRALKSPSNLTGRTTFSPYSRESSVQSFSTPVAMNKGATSAVQGRQLYSQPAGLFPHHGNLNSQQDSTAYVSPGFSVQHHERLPETNLSLSGTGSQFEHYSNNDAIALQRGGPDPFRCSEEFSPYDRNRSGWSFASIADASAYQPHGATEHSRRVSFESPSSMGRADYRYPVDPPLHAGSDPHDPRVRHVLQERFGRPSFASPSSIGRPGYSYPADPPSYGSPSAHPHMPGVPLLERNALGTPPPYEWRSLHQTTSGSPYPSSAPRPPSGTPPTDHRYGFGYR